MQLITSTTSMSSTVTTLAICIVAFFCASRILAQGPVLCDTAGCLSGECLQPPAVPTPVCNCTAGFQTVSDPNVCEDINECDSVFKCGYTFVYNYKQQHSYLHSGYPPYWPFIPAGRCVNYPGSYYCLCYPPSRPTYRYDYCISPPPRRRTPSDTIRYLRRLEQLEIIDL